MLFHLSSAAETIKLNYREINLNSMPPCEMGLQLCTEPISSIKLSKISLFDVEKTSTTTTFGLQLALIQRSCGRQYWTFGRRWKKDVIWRHSLHLQGTKIGRSKTTYKRRRLDVSLRSGLCANVKYKLRKCVRKISVQ